MSIIMFSGVLQKHKWENAMTIDKVSWGYRQEAKIEDFLTVAEIVKGMIFIVLVFARQFD